MFHRKLNQVACTFDFPINLYGNALQGVDTDAKYFIEINMDSGYWKVVAEEEARLKLELLNLDGKRLCKVMNMGALNSYPIVLEMSVKLQK